MNTNIQWLLSLVIVVCGCATASPDKPTDKPATPYDHHAFESVRARNLTPTASTKENVVLRDATVMTATGEIIENGDVWIRDGKIIAIGADLEATDAQEVDARGKWVTPGLIDTHSHLGLYPVPYVEAHSDGNEATAPTRADVDAIHSVWPQDPGFFTALQGGITSMQILPGSANLIGGAAVTLQMHPAVSARAMAFEEAPRGLKMACGENPKNVYGEKGGPSTRMGSMAGFRAAFEEARAAIEAEEKFELQMGTWQANEGKEVDKPAGPARNRGVETLMAAIRGEVLVHVHCYRADEMIQILELADEFGFSVRSFHHAVEAYKIRDILAKWDVGVSTWADWWGFKIEAFDAIPENAGLLTEAGARAIIHSDDPVGIQRLNQEAAKALAAARKSNIAVSDDQALRWITANPAWALGVDSVTGTLQEGKRADIVLWSAHPFSVYATAELVFVEGVREFELGKTKPWSDFGQYLLPEETR
jgi:imidazolonepropionase-like amidohydrolase